MERETLNLKPNEIGIFNGDVNNDENDTFRLNNLPKACKVEAKRCEQNSLSCGNHLKKTVSSFPSNEEHSELEISSSSHNGFSKHKNGEVTNQILPIGVNGICLKSGKKTATNDLTKTFGSIEGDNWLQELENLCVSRDENDRIDDVNCSRVTPINISNNEDGCSSKVVNLSTSTDQSKTTKQPLGDESTSQLHSNGTSSSTNLQSSEIIDDKDGENLLEKIGVDIEPYENENDLPGIMALITKDLSEPYSIYTYRYFIHNWPQICFKAKLKEDPSVFVGAIVCKLDQHRMARRGYIAMLAVHSDYRRYKIASTLVRYAIRQMSKMGCDEVVLETEVTNKAAMRLYEKFGFIKDKRLHRYYLNGVDAFRLKLWLQSN